MATEEASDAQLEQSKQLFGEGLEAMSRKDFTTAQAKFSEAYKLAPHLHLFNYNIAVAAQLGGDCRTAQLAFQSFLDLVPEHPERRDASKRLEKLKRECPVDLESESVLSTEGQAKRDQERTIERAISAINDLLVQLQWGEDYYQGAYGVFPRREFRQAGAHKKRDIRKLRKLMASHRVRDEKREPLPYVLPDEVKAGCRKGRSHEGRVARAASESLKYFETKASVRVLSKILRTAEKDGERFDSCVR